MSADIERAVGLVKRKYRLLPNNEESAWIIELYKSSSKPIISPYHIEHPIQQVYSYIVKNRLDIYAESKYDGSHVQFSPSGIFKHSGTRIAFDQLAHLLFIAVNDPELISRIRRAISDGFVVECELFGRDYTPRGFHKDYVKPLDLTVFEIGRNNSWIPPPEKYEILESIGLPFPPYVKVNYVNENDLVEKLSSLALKPETFEGVVVKAKFVPNDHDIREYVKSGSLLIFKVKKEIQEVVKSVQKKKPGKSSIVNVDVEVLKILKLEIENEIAKLTVEKGIGYVSNRKNIGNMINEIFSRLEVAHPSLVVKVDSKSLRKLIASLILSSIFKGEKNK